MFKTASRRKELDALSIKSTGVQINEKGISETMETTLIVTIVALGAVGVMLFLAAKINIGAESTGKTIIDQTTNSGGVPGPR